MNPIEVFREYRGMTQAALAGEAELSSMYLSQRERGKRRSGRRALGKLAAAGARRGHLPFLAAAAMWAGFTLALRRPGLDPWHAAAPVSAHSLAGIGGVSLGVVLAGRAVFRAG